MDSIPSPAPKPKFAFFKRFLSKPYGASLVSVIGVAILSGAVPLLFAIMESSGGEIAFVFAMLATALSYALILLVPALSFGFGKGWKAGVSVIAYDVLWMVLIVILVAFLMPSPDVMY